MRDPIPGSDWRNDGGWAIVLERRGGRILPAYTYYAKAGAVQSTIISPSLIAVNYNYPVAVGDGRTAYVQTSNQNAAIIDLNNDGVIRRNDDSTGNIYQTIAVTAVAVPERHSGGPYIRWANMAYCR